MVERKIVVPRRPAEGMECSPYPIEYLMKLVSDDACAVSKGSYASSCCCIGTIDNHLVVIGVGGGIGGVFDINQLEFVEKRAKENILEIAAKLASSYEASVEDRTHRPFDYKWPKIA